MNRYIDVDKIDWRLIIPTNPTTAEENMIYRARKLVESQPNADVVEVVHGEWIYNKTSTLWECSNCHEEEIRTTTYCPHCGAKMDERREDGNHN